MKNRVGSHMTKGWDMTNSIIYRTDRDSWNTDRLLDVLPCGIAAADEYSRSHAQHKLAVTLWLRQRRDAGENTRYSVQNLLHEIAYVCDAETGRFPADGDTLDELLDRIQISKKYGLRLIGELRDLGVVERIRRGGRGRPAIYRLALPIPPDKSALYPIVLDWAESWGWSEADLAQALRMHPELGW